MVWKGSNKIDKVEVKVDKGNKENNKITYTKDKEEKEIKLLENEIYIHYHRKKFKEEDVDTYNKYKDCKKGINAAGVLRKQRSVVSSMIKEANNDKNNKNEDVQNFLTELENNKGLTDDQMKNFAQSIITSINIEDAANKINTFGSDIKKALSKPNDEEAVRKAILDFFLMLDELKDKNKSGKYLYQSLTGKKKIERKNFKWSEKDGIYAKRLMEKMQQHFSKKTIKQIVKMFNKNSANTLFSKNFLSTYFGEAFAAKSLSTATNAVNTTLSGQTGVGSVFDENDLKSGKTDVFIDSRWSVSKDGNNMSLSLSNDEKDLLLKIGFSIKTYTTTAKGGSIPTSVNLGGNGTIGDLIDRIYNSQKAPYNSARWAFSLSPIYDTDTNFLIDTLTKQALYYQLVTRSGNEKDFAMILCVNGRLYSTQDILKQALYDKDQQVTASLRSGGSTQLAALHLDYAGRTLLSKVSKWRSRDDEKNTESAKIRSQAVVTVIKKQLKYTMELYLSQIGKKKKVQAS